REWASHRRRSARHVRAGGARAAQTRARRGAGQARRSRRQPARRGGDHGDTDRMSVLRRLYQHLRRYRGWALVAIASMVMFAATQTALMALGQTRFADALSPSHLS